MKLGGRETFPGKRDHFRGFLKILYTKKTSCFSVKKKKTRSKFLADIIFQSLMSISSNHPLNQRRPLKR